MSLFSHFFSQYGFILLLTAWLILTVYFRKREERRLASGWRRVENSSRIAGLMRYLSNFLFAAWLGACISESFHVSSETIFAFCLVMMLATPYSKWIPPTGSENYDCQ